MTRALYLHHPLSLEHDTGEHPEQPARIRAIEQALEARDWLGFERELAPAVPLDALHAVHPAAVRRRDPPHLRAGRRACWTSTPSRARSRTEAALHSAGGDVRAVDALLERRGGSSPSAGCVLPGTMPSHRARWASASSTTSPWRRATRSTRDGAERVLVLDWDVHHGNGTNDIFYASRRGALRQHPSVAALSRHRRAGGQRRGARARATRSTFPCRPAPGTETGCRSCSTSSCRSRAAYRPGLVLVSAGFDAHRDDPLANCELSEESFAAHGGGHARAGAASSTRRSASCSRAGTTCGR